MALNSIAIDWTNQLEGITHLGVVCVNRSEKQHLINLKYVLLELKFEREKHIRLLIEQDSENKLTQRKYLSCYAVKVLLFWSCV